jgi:hypothetical protein
MCRLRKRAASVLTGCLSKIDRGSAVFSYMAGYLK